MLGDNINCPTLLQTIIDSLPVIVQIRNQAGQYVLVNQLACQRFGKHAGEIIGRTNADFLPRDEAQRVQHEDNQLLKSGRTIKAERQLYIAATGQWGWFEVYKTPLSFNENERGNHDYVLATLVDITALTERLRQTKQSKQRAEYNRDLLALAIKATTQTESELI